MTAPENPPEYNPNVPQAEDSLDVSQGNFLNNFITLYDAFSLNHVALDDTTNPGKHSVVELVQQTQKLSTLQQEISIYSKKVDDQTEQLFMRYNSNGKEFQITNYQIYSIAANSNQTSYFSFLPGGIIVYFGKAFAKGKSSFYIYLNPNICTAITGVNLGGIDTISSQPNVAPVVSGTGFSIFLQSASAMPDQFYLIFGNTGKP